MEKKIDRQNALFEHGFLCKFRMNVSLYNIIRYSNFVFLANRIVFFTVDQRRGHCFVNKCNNK